MNSSLRVIAAWLECFPDKLSWCRNEQVCALSGPTDCKGPTALYNNYLYLFYIVGWDSRSRPVLFGHSIMQMRSRLLVFALLVNDLI